MPAAVSAISTTRTNPSCGQSDGVINITSITGGTAPYTFRLNLNPPTTSATFTGLAAAAYSINITDANGCYSGFGVPALVSAGGPSSITTSNINSNCGQPNGVVNVTGVTGGTSPFTYSLNGSPFTSSATFSGVSAGGFVPLVVKDANGCTFTKSTLVNNSGVTPPTPTISQSGFLLTSSASTGNQWFLDGVALSGQTGQTHFATQNGSYTVIVTSGGCSSAPSAPVVITDLGGRYMQNNADTSDNDATVIESGVKGNTDGGHSKNAVAEQTDLPVVNVFPNPTDGDFTVSGFEPGKTDLKLEVINSIGVVVFREEMKNYSGEYAKSIHLREYGKGIYLVVVTSGKSRTTKKVIIN